MNPINIDYWVHRQLRELVENQNALSQVLNSRREADEIDCVKLQRQFMEELQDLRQSMEAATAKLLVASKPDATFVPEAPEEKWQAPRTHSVPEALPDFEDWLANLRRLSGILHADLVEGPASDRKAELPLILTTPPPSTRTPLSQSPVSSWRGRKEARRDGALMASQSPQPPRLSTEGRFDAGWSPLPQTAPTRRTPITPPRSTPLDRPPEHLQNPL